MLNYGIWRWRGAFTKQEFKNLKNHQIVDRCFAGDGSVVKMFDNSFGCIGEFDRHYTKSHMIVYPNDIVVWIYAAWQVDDLGKPVLELRVSSMQFDNPDNITVENVDN